jgi:hypothetical protein
MSRFPCRFLVLGICGAAAVLVPASARAHHILGLPHYKYDESYPQIPFVEVQAQTAAHTLTFTYLPGTPVPGERVRFKLYVQAMASGKPFREPLTAQFFRAHTFGDDEPLGEPFTLRVGSGPEGNDYKFFYTFDANDSYVLRLSFPEGGTVEVVPFPVQVGQTDDRPLLLGAVVILIGTIIGVRIAKTRRSRKGGPGKGGKAAGPSTAASSEEARRAA